jgi:hypothetical protein
MKWTLLIGSAFFIEVSVVSQQLVNFYTSDSIKITADFYKSGVSNSFVIFFH